MAGILARQFFVFAGTLIWHRNTRKDVFPSLRTGWSLKIELPEIKCLQKSVHVANLSYVSSLMEQQN
jgi:hypothetical protein